MRAWALGAAFLLLAGCAPLEDVPSNVRDLRLLAVRLDPPELMAPECTSDLLALAPVYAQDVGYTALITDPAGEGRAIQAELLACASPADRTCQTQGERYLIKTIPDIAAGELFLDLGALGLTGFPDDPLLLKVLEEDPFGGLGGVRVPLVLHLRAADEEIYAQKLMVYSCRFFADQTQNVNPELPGVSLNGVTWGPADVPILEGSGPFGMEPEPFEDRQEAYVVPSFQLERVDLVESWKIAWHADYGRLQPEETGGTDLGGVSSRHFVEWSPPQDATERDVRFWMVARDGRGGTSWITRTAHHRP
jgi:hypothetical protein